MNGLSLHILLHAIKLSFCLVEISHHLPLLLDLLEKILVDLHLAEFLLYYFQLLLSIHFLNTSGQDNRVWSQVFYLIQTLSQLLFVLLEFDVGLEHLVCLVLSAEFLNLLIYKLHFLNKKGQAKQDLFTPFVMSASDFLFQQTFNFDIERTNFVFLLLE